MVTWKIEIHAVNGDVHVYHTSSHASAKAFIERNAHEGAALTVTVKAEDNELAAELFELSNKLRMF